MNRQLINEFGQDILCYRLRTRRHKIRMQYEDFDKQLMRIDREETVLWQQRNKLGWEPLLPPVQRGWKRTFVLREDVAMTDRADFFNSILKKINTVERSWRKDFKKKKRYMGRKIYVVKPQYLKKLDLWEWRKAAFNEAEQQFFECVFSIDKSGYVKQKYVFTGPWRFVLKISPNIIDKVRIRDVVIEQRLKEIDNYLTRNDYKGRIQKVVYGGNGWNHQTRKIQKRSGGSKKPITHLLQQLVSYQDTVLSGNG
jgi:hypothetical protein